MSELAEALIRAFPSGQREVALESAKYFESAKATLSSTTLHVVVEAEAVAIPYRVSVNEGDLHGLRSTMPAHVSCLLTRHHDGHVRAQALEYIIKLNHSWSIPFIVQLIGEYVIEILDKIDLAFDTINQNQLGQFIQANPMFMQLIEQRVESYWDCHYRRLGRVDYVGFRLVQRLYRVGKTNAKQA